MFRLLVAIVSLVSLSSSVYGQWTIVARNILGTVAPVGNAGGVVTYQGNRVWAGDRSLWFSTDLGLTWQQSFVPFDTASYRISDVKFFDASNGLLSTFGFTGSGKIFRTSDAGNSWQAIDSLRNNGFTCIAYGRTVNDITTAAGGITRVSHDGGQSWLNGGASVLFLVRQGSRIITIDQGPGHASTANVNVTADDGMTWSMTPGMVPFDCYSLALDSCLVDRFVVANENYWTIDPPISHVLITSDAGVTWNTVFTGTRTSNRLCGAVARGKRAIYCTTMFDGVLQSVDYGITWKSIGGPVSVPDSRGISCITDNLLIAMDAAGSIWRTTNAGGSRVYIPTTNDTRFTPDRLFVKDSLSVCDSSVTRFAYLPSSACDQRALTGEQIVGPDAAYFKLLRGLPAYPTGYDSIAIAFHADSVRAYRAVYVVSRGSEIDSVRLIGNGRAIARTIAATTNSVIFDTISACNREQKAVWLRSSSCTPWRVVSYGVTGADSAYFSLDLSTPFVLTGLDSLEVNFHPDTARGYHARLHIVLDDSTKIDLPMEGYGAPTAAAIAMNRASLFDTVRRSACESAMERLWIDDTACIRHSIVSCRVTGVDSASYSVSGVTGSLPDSIEVVFAADTVRAYHATLELRLSDSSIVRIPLHGEGSKAIHGFTTPSPFIFEDSVSRCDEPIAGWIVLHDTACRWRHIQSVELQGAKQLWLDDRRFSDDGTIDSIRVIFYGGPKAEYDATVAVTFDDTTIVIPIAAFGKDIARSLSLSSSSLFLGDTVSPCAAPLVREVVLTDSCCLPWRVTSYEWSGADSVYYSIIHPLPSKLTGSDTLRVLFTPDAPRHYSAQLTIVLDDGRTIPLTLGGDGMPYVQVALTSTDLSTSAVGDDLHVPIYLSHSGAIPSVRFSARYDTSLLVFTGARTTTGQSIVTGRESDRAFHVRIDSASIGQDGLVGYLDFQIFPTTDSCGFITLDSLQFESLAPKTCAVITMDSAVVRVCGPYDCTTPIFSNFLRNGALPKLTVSPNPTTSTLRVATDLNLGLCSLTLYSELGEQVASLQLDLAVHTPGVIDLAALPKGRYYLSIVAESGYKKSFTVLKK